MNFGELFRSVFGLPYRDPPQSPGENFDSFGGIPGSGTPGGGRPYFDDHPHGSPPDEDNDDDDHDTHPNMPFGAPWQGDTFTFRSFSDTDDMFRHFEDMFRGFDEVFRSMGMADFPPVMPAPPGGNAEREGTLRDRMLKEPDSDQQQAPSAQPPPHIPDRFGAEPRLPSLFGGLWESPGWNQRRNPEEKIDRDLDGDLKPGDLDKILSESETQKTPTDLVPVEPGQGRVRSSFKRVSVRTVRGADGRLEEHRTVEDGAGNRETTVTRTVDGQTHSVTTKTDKKGTEEKVEDFVNLREGEKKSFEEKWAAPGYTTPHTSTPRDEMIQGERLDPQTRNIFKNIFGLEMPFDKS